MITKQLRKITQQEFNDSLDQHFLYQKGDETKQMIFKDCDFTNISLQNTNLSGAIFDGSDFTNSISFYKNEQGKGVFSGTNLSNVSFKGSNLKGIDFGSAVSMKGAILLDAKFHAKSLSVFQDDVIVTELQMEKLSQKAIQQEDIILRQDKQIEKKDEALEKTSEKQSKNMLDIFQELQKDFSYEERIWIVVGYMIFSILLFITSCIISNISPIISAFINFIFLTTIGVIIDLTKNKERSKAIKYSLDEWITIIFMCIVNVGPLIYFSELSRVIIFNSGESWFKIMSPNLTKWEFIAPISVLFFSIFWFSIHQYGRAKKLRIEQQNKQAMIHFMNAIIANDGKGAPADRSFPQLAPFFANAIIHRPFSQENYDPQLPIDEVKKVIDMAKLFQK